MEAPQAQQEDPGPPRAQRPTVVGLGASAGGLAALKAFFAHVPEDSGLAFVVVVHLSPEHESHLAEILQPHVPVPVQQVTATTKIEPDHVYVIPPGANLSAVDTHLRLSDLEARRRERAPIDHFFRTLAKTHDGRSAAVVLTGTGSDGTLGLREVKQAGGLTVAQDPREAEYDGMPQSAVASGMVDLVLPLAEIPAAVLRFAHTEPRVPVPEDGEDAEGDARRLLQKVLAQVRARTGRDFTRYKRSTVLRRIARRMQLRHVEELEAYLGLLRAHPEEVRALADDLLITVTNFFRDPEAFEALAQEVVPQLFEGKAPDESVRVWSVGCATGEEAYSLAILLLEEAARREARGEGPPPRLQVFASDLHEASLQKARDGFYPGDVEADVSAERLQRFFLKEDGGYRVRKEVRDLVVFAPHNLLADPPFSKLDLVACRNVLIYLERGVQKEVTALFHYALRPGGLLVLGAAETIEGTDLFQVEDKKRCVYRKRNVQAPEPRLPVFPLVRARRPEGPAERLAEPLAYGALHLRMVERYAPPSLLVSADEKVVHLSEHAGRYLALPGGELTANVYRLVREELRVELRAALRAARERGEPVRTEPVAVRFDSHTGRVALDVRPAPGGEAEGFALVIFDERGEAPAAASPEARARRGAAPGAQEAEVEAELDLARQRLQAIIEEYETSQEELKASNEELQSANEELRSTLEELETSREELQSMNEELQTVNQENRHKVEELGQLAGDLQNLLAATDIATLFLDRDLRILRFTPKVGALFNVRPADRGRPLSDITHRLGYGDLLDDALRVLETLVPAEREVADESGCWYLTRVLPYRSAEDRIEGVVVTFVDITERKRAEEEVHEARVYAESIVETLHEPLLVLHPDLRVRSANQAFFDHFEVRPEDTLGRLVYELGNSQWDIPELRTLLEDVLPDSNVFNDFEVTHEFEDIGRRVMLVNARRLDHVQLILLGIRDVTERKRAEDALRESEARFRQLAEAVPDVVFTTTPDGVVDYVSPRREELTGQPPETALGTRMWPDLIHPADREAAVAAWDEARAHGRPFELRYRLRMADGAYCWFIARARPAFDDGGGLARWFGTLTDVDALTQAEAALRESEERYRLLVESAREYAILMLDSDNRITMWSAGAERVFGYTEAEALGQSGALIFTEEDRAAGVPARELAAAAEAGRAADDRWHLRKDGARFWASGVVEALYDEDGALLGFTKVLRDNTARKEAEEAVRASEERLQLALQAAAAGAWEYHPARGEQHWSPELFDLFGVAPTPGHVVAGRWPATVPEEEAARLDRLVEGLFARRSREWELEYRLEHPTRGERWFSSRGHVTYGTDGRPFRVVGICVDVTERKWAEEALRRVNQTLEEQVRERTREVRALATRLTLAEQAERHRLAEILHDDLQQQLFGLSVLLDLLPETEHPEERAELHARAAETLTEATDLTRSLSTELSPPVLASDRLAELLGWLAEKKREQHGLEVAVEVAEPCVVPHHETRVLLYRVLQEALFNVAKHAGTDRARLRARCNGAEAVVEVEDEGAGFDPSSAAAAARGAGGFGLSNVRERLRLAGGRLEVASAPGEGTRVTITVPVGGEHAVEGPPPQENPGGEIP